MPPLALLEEGSAVPLQQVLQEGTIVHLPHQKTCDLAVPAAMGGGAIALHMGIAAVRLPDSTEEETPEGDTPLHPVHEDGGQGPRHLVQPLPVRAMDVTAGGARYHVIEEERDGLEIGHQKDVAAAAAAEVLQAGELLWK